MLAEQRKLYRLLKLMAMLKLAGGKTIKSLAELLEVSTRTVYRYLELLESVGIPVDSKPGSDRWFMVTPDDDNHGAGFSLEETTLLRDLVMAGAHHHPLRDGILQKLYLQSELKPLAENLVNARVNIMLDKLVKAIKEERQIILKNYHSAHSGEVKDYRVEPFDFTENYHTVQAYDVSDAISKQFKLERISEVLLLDKRQKFRNRHEQMTTDVFGCSGQNPVTITLELSLRAYLLLREEFPRSLPYISRDEESGKYIFYGAVNGFEGAGRFVLGLIDEIEIKSPEAFRDFVGRKVAAGMEESG